MTDSAPFILAVESDNTCRIILDKLFTQKMNLPKSEIWADSTNFNEKIQALSEIPQLVLLDIKVVPFHGYEMLNLLRANADFNNTKLIAFTAGVMPEEITELKNAGFDGLISKPIVRSNFPNIIYSIIDGQSIWYIS